MDFLDTCPEVTSCCYCIPLREAIFCICGVSLIWSAYFFAGATRPVLDMAVKMSMPHELRPLMLPVHIIIGLLIMIAHAVLAAGVYKESDLLCEVYIWYMIGLWWFISFLGVSFFFSTVAWAFYALGLVYICLLLPPLLSFLQFIIVVAAYRRTLL